MRQPIKDRATLESDNRALYGLIEELNKAKMEFERIGIDPVEISAATGDAHARINSNLDILFREHYTE